MIVGVDPVADGLVASLPRPGGNITGVTALSSDLIEKRLGLLSEVIPRGSPIAYMWNPGNPGNVSAWEQTRKVAPTMRLTVQPAPMSDRHGTGRSVRSHGDAADRWPSRRR